MCCQVVVFTVSEEFLFDQSRVHGRSISSETSLIWDLASIALWTDHLSQYGFNDLVYYWEDCNPSVVCSYSLFS